MFQPIRAKSKPRSPRPPAGGSFAVAAAVLWALGGAFSCDRPNPQHAAQEAPAPPESPVDGAVLFTVAAESERTGVTFAFPPPLDDYSGWAKSVSGELSMHLDGGAATLRGYIEVQTASVTLGEADIDANAHSSMFMDVEKHPTSRFTITRIESVPPAPMTGEPVSFIMHGEFQLKGHAVQIQVPATLSPNRSPLGDFVAYDLSAAWEINILKPFGIPGPSTGEAGERVLLKSRLRLTPKAD